MKTILFLTALLYLNSAQALGLTLADSPLLKNWGLNKTQAAKAWRVKKKSKKIMIAIIDTGTDVNHPDLQKNLWMNPGEVGKDKNGESKMNNQLDDDGNGYIDDVYGWNFADESNDVSDKHGHGTHIAGIISAETGSIKNGDEDANIEIMTLKYYDPASVQTNNVLNIVKAIDYAIQMKADIINYSGGGPGKNLMEEAAIKRAEAKGILFVAAAGNERSNSDRYGYYPADYHLSNIISVTAINKDNEVLSSSNYGEKTVDIAAPGEQIFSTLPGGSYGYMTGTSQATAFVTAAAAMIMSKTDCAAKAPEVIKRLVQTGDHQDSLYLKTKYNVQLNSFKALAMSDQGTDAFGIRVTNAAEIDENLFLLNHNKEGSSPLRLSERP